MKKRLLYALYNLLLIIAIPFIFLYYLLRSVRQRHYRQDFFQRLGFISQETLKQIKGHKPLWFHAVSVGEVNALSPLVRRLKKLHPELKILISTITPTGRAVVKRNLSFVDSIIYLPIDLPWIVGSVIKRIKPRLFCIVETEVWPNLLRGSKKRGIPVIMVNGRISFKSFRRYSLFRFFFREVFDNLTYLSMQSKEDAERIVALGADRKRLSITGNIKYHHDDLPFKSEDVEGIGKEFGIKPCDRIIVAGSSHRGEEEILIWVFSKLKEKYSSLKLIIAPRHPERFNEVEEIVKRSGLSVTRKSEGKGFEDRIDVLLLDTIGDLRRVYAISTVAFVGGSMVKKGGQNIIEPACHKKPILFGPHMDNFLSIASALERGGGGIRVRNGEELFSHIDKLLSEPQLCQIMGEAAYRVVESNKGALEKNIKIIERILNSGPNLEF